MKHITILMLAAALIMTGCEKEEKAPLKITLDSETAVLSTDKTETIGFTAENADGTVKASVQSDKVTLSESTYDSVTRKGTITLATSSDKKETYDITVTFKDNSGTAEKKITVNNKSTWSIEPSDPQS